MATEWTSLEVVKLAVSFLTPVVVVVLGVMVTRAAKRVEDAQWSNRKLIEKRLELYSAMAPPLNDLYCCFRMVGHFREVTPPVAIERKRELDKVFYANEYLMTQEFRDLYHAFMDMCFETWKHAGEDAKLKSSVATQKEERGRQTEWEPEWNDLFVADPGETATRESIVASYRAVMEQFAMDCGMRDTEPA